jgi:hypothetical protein
VAVAAGSESATATPAGGDCWTSIGKSDVEPVSSAPGGAGSGAAGGGATAAGTAGGAAVFSGLVDGLVGAGEGWLVGCPARAGRNNSGSR